MRWLQNKGLVHLRNDFTTDSVSFQLSVSGFAHSLRMMWTRMRKPHNRSQEMITLRRIKMVSSLLLGTVGILPRLTCE